MTTQRKLELTACALATLVLAALIFAGIADHRARTTAEQKSAIDEKSVSTANAAIAQRDATATDLRKQLQKRAAAITTPQAAAKVIVLHIPSGTVQPIETITRAELPAAVQAKLPDSPSYTMLTDSQAEDVAKLQLACDADRHELQACKADIVDLRTEVAAKADEAAQWKKAANGGTKWQRFGRVLKFAACAGGGAALGHVVDDSARGVAIGGAVAVAGCSFFKP